MSARPEISEEELHAFIDSCPHRRARLSGGTVEGRELVCPYHGYRFAHFRHHRRFFHGGYYPYYHHRCRIVWTHYGPRRVCWHRWHHRYW